MKVHINRNAKMTVFQISLSLSYYTSLFFFFFLVFANYNIPPQELVYYLDSLYFDLEKPIEIHFESVSGVQ